VAAGRGQRSICPQAPAEGAPKGGAVIFCDKNYTKILFFTVEAEMGMEGQIMCVEQCTF